MGLRLAPLWFVHGRIAPPQSMRLHA